MADDTEFWTSHVVACRQEGAAASEYARRHGLTVASLYYWRRKLKLAAGGSEDGGSAQAAKFVALRLMDGPASAPATSACTLVLHSGLRLELAALPPPAWLLAVEQAQAGAR